MFHVEHLVRNRRIVICDKDCYQAPKIKKEWIGGD